MSKPSTLPAIIISAPSGAGKTTLNRRLLRDCPQITMVTSHTTRSPRVGEKQGDHYHFVGEAEFLELVKNNAFLEWAKVHNNYYGTSLSALEAIRAAGKRPLLEIDVQGWKQAKDKLPGALSIFILPPSLKDLWDRLGMRGSDSPSVRWLRLQNGLEEIEGLGSYTHFLINKDFDHCLHQLRQLVEKGQDAISYADGLKHAATLREEFEQAEWVKTLKNSFHL